MKCNSIKDDGCEESVRRSSKKCCGYSVTKECTEALYKKGIQSQHRRSGCHAKVLLPSFRIYFSSTYLLIILTQAVAIQAGKGGTSGSSSREGHDHYSS